MLQSFLIPLKLNLINKFFQFVSLWDFISKPTRYKRDFVKGFQNILKYCIVSAHLIKDHNKNI